MSERQETVAQALRRGTGLLAASSGSPRLDAEVLLSHVLGWPRVRLLAEHMAPLPAEARQRFDQLLERRAALEPVAYLVGHKEFYGLDFVVDRRVLVPRPETELLVELALRWLQDHAGSRPLIADLGTGSGCIAVALAAQQPDARVYAIDRSPEALEVARLNCRRHAVDERVVLLHGDGLAELPEPVDLLVSNPPYTLLAEIDPGVRLHEPQLALDGGPDGLAVYRWLLPAARVALRPRGALLLEIGATQGPAVSSLARASFPAARLQLYPDLAGHDRVVAVYL